MVIFLLYLLFYWLDMGDLLCQCYAGKMGEPRIYAGTISSDLWFGSYYHTDFYVAISNTGDSRVFLWNDKCDDIGILYRCGDGEAVSCSLLGL